MVALRTGLPVIGQINGLLVAGQGRRWFSVNARPRFVDGDLAGAVVTLSDITERKAAEDGLRESEIRFRTLAESLPVGIFHADVHAAIDYANPRWLEITDVNADQVADPSTAEMIHPADRAAVWRELGEAFTAHRPYHVQYRIHTRDGSVRWLSARGSRTYDPESGEATGIVGSIEDVTPLLEAQERNARLASIVESTSDLAGIVDWHSGLMLYLNRAGRELLGYVDRDITTVHHLELFTDQAARIVQDDLETTLRNGEVWSGELPMRAADGSTVMVWQTIAAERLPDGDIYQLSAVGRDVTERRRFEDELAWQATHDAHTRLPNRAMLIDHVELALARASARQPRRPPLPRPRPLQAGQRHPGPRRR
jgi:PAS domain S-box-containing protein